VGPFWWDGTDRGTQREYGIVFPAGAEVFYSSAEKESLKIPYDMIRNFLVSQVNEVKRLREQEKQLEAELERTYGQDDRVKRLRTIPGVGPMVSLAMLAIADNDITRFPNASCFASFLGLVPSVSASANKRMMGNITRSGPEMLRRDLIHGARAWMRYSAENGDRNRQWAEQVKARRGQNKAVVALAHRIARICFAVLRDGTTYNFPKKKLSELRAAPAKPQEGQAA
jgi:transposase